MNLQNLHKVQLSSIKVEVKVHDIIAEITYSLWMANQNINCD